MFQCTEIMHTKIVHQKYFKLWPIFVAQYSWVGCRRGHEKLSQNQNKNTVQHLKSPENIIIMDI